MVSRKKSPTKKTARTRATKKTAPARKARSERQAGPALDLPPRRVKPAAEIVLVCNPRAGGRWRELAEILDSEEARHVRRIVTDSVNDIAPAIASLGSNAELVCIYGGDGTIQRILEYMRYRRKHEPHLALLGGGTMNVTARWCGMSSSPAANFREVVEAYRTGQLLLKEVPLLEVRQGKEHHVGFTFGMGPIVRLLNEYEQSPKGKARAVALGIKAVAATVTRRPASMMKLLEQIDAEVRMDDELLDYRSFIGVFANVTGQLNPGVKPFVETGSRKSFYCAAYGVTAREFALALPFLMRGWLPIDPARILDIASVWRRLGSRLKNLKNPLPTDPRYVNRTASSLEVRTNESLYTVDGELLKSNGEPFRIALGPRLKLAVSSTVALRHPVRLAARVIR